MWSVAATSSTKMSHGKGGNAKSNRMHCRDAEKGKSKSALMMAATRISSGPSLDACIHNANRFRTLPATPRAFKRNTLSEMAEDKNAFGTLRDPNLFPDTRMLNIVRHSRLCRFEMMS